MTTQTVGILHPGQMGISVAAAAQNGGHTVYWASQDRSADTRARAEKHGLRDAGTLDKLCAACSVVISVCPPHAAEEVAHAVVERGFRGLYVDANAISPQRAQRIATAVHEGGSVFVDGGIIGPPAWKPDATWLYLSGPDADKAAALFAAGPLQAVVMGEEPGRASALKMCYAANTKGTTALLTAVLGAAEALGVTAALQEQWRQEGSGLDVDAPHRARNVTSKAWRFAGEMDEIAATFEGAGMPGGFHAAAGDIYRRLAGFKDVAETPSLEEVLSALLAVAVTGGDTPA
jgi:3-hydroxyisobutyrate dehydrogenase-like beta-hydroxyacid dehydrogenase